MKKKKILSALMAVAMIFPMVANPVRAEEPGPYIDNPSFEKEIDNNENQMYKAERTKDEAYDGDYSIKIGMAKPTDESKVPLWLYTQGKGSVNVIIHNVKPNTTYEVTTHYKKASPVKISTGVVDVDGKHTTSPWQLASSIETSSVNVDLDGQWKEHKHTITTGPRTDEIYAFAYTEWTGNEEGSGLFYVDGFDVKEKESKVSNVATIGYKALPSYEFPATVPAIQSFEKTYDTFNLNVEKQIFSTDDFSKDKTKYFAESMKDKGIIKDYEIKTISNVEEGQGIVVAKQPIQFDLPKNIEDSKVDAYQIDITKDKVAVYSDYIEGIQNGTMTLLQAFAQRKVIPTGTVKDYTDQVVRGLQVDSGRRYYSIDWLKNQIEQMAYYKQNKLQLRLKDNEGIRYDSKVASAMKDDKGGFWTKEEVTELVNYAEKFNIEVIPEIDFPGHAEQDAAYYKDWGLGGSTKALDFSKEEVRKYMIDVYKEAVEFFDAKTIHIGGDEFFQSGYTSKGEEILTAWAKEVTGNENATDYDALKLFFNEASESLKKEYPGINVLVWNDNMKTLDGVVPLNKDIIVDFWAGGFYGSITASNAANAGYRILSSSSSNYHDLWPQENNMKLDRPLPKSLYDEFTRYNYSHGSTYYSEDEILTENLDMSLGQMFPIWDDAHGYVPEYILSRTLFPRYGGFAYKTWGADYINEIDYSQFENLLFMIGSPRTNLFPQVKVNYTKADLDLIITEIESALDSRTVTFNTKNSSENISVLTDLIKKVKTNTNEYEKNGYYNDIVKELINLYENIDNTEDEEVETTDKTELLKVIKSVSDIDLSNYEIDTVLELSRVLKRAETVMADKSSLQETVNSAVKALNKAIEDLKLRPADYTNVDLAIQEANKCLSNPEDWEGIEDIQAAVDAVERDLDCTQQDKVDAMAKAIYDAIDKAVFVGEADKSELLNAVEKCRNELDNNGWQYKDEILEQLKEYISLGESVLNKIHATPDEVEKMTLDINTFLAGNKWGQWYKEADVTELNIVYKEAQELNPDFYVNYDIMEEPLYGADELLVYFEWGMLSIKEQQRVDEAVKALKDAMAALEYKEADYTLVDKAIEHSKTFNKDVYANFDKVEKAIDAVVRGKKINEQEEVDAMANAIENAINLLEYKNADYSKVDEAIKKANQLDKNQYKDFTEVEKAIDAVVRDKKITEQEAVDAMANAIENAISKLELKEQIHIDTDTDTDKESNNNSSNKVETGDTTPVIVTLSIMIISGSMYLWLRKKRS